ncbi:hypothetical protein TcCL_NonESM07537 [Trypanosoma cruzi]|nr:hypothetical protein TcCL_NonESM07537 [Trypanosoma cruzi]
MHEVLPATCIICDARALNQQTRQYAPLDSLRNPLTILSQSSPWAMREEHHGKNAQELIRKPLNSFRVNKSMAPYMRFTTMSTCSFLRSLQYTSHVITIKKKQLLQSGCHPAANIKAQSNKMPQTITYFTQTIDSLRGKCTARKKSHAHKHATHRHSKRDGKSSAQCHSLWMQMIIAPNNVRHQSGTTYGPQTPPTHPFTLPPPNGVALLHLRKHVCCSVMFASNASHSRCVSVIQNSTPRKNRGHARRDHTAPQRSLKPSPGLFNAAERNTGGSRVTEGGQWERCPHAENAKM